MVNSHNLCMFTGRLTKDPELTYTANNKPMCRFSLAIDKKLDKSTRDAAKTDKSIQTADFPEFTAFNGSAEMISKYFTKGKPISLVASFNSSSRKNPTTGNIDYFKNFLVEEINFALTDNSSAGQGQGGQQSSAPRPQQQAPAKPQTFVPINQDFIGDDDDLPF